MSAWSDWRVGALTDEEYRNECVKEDQRDRIELDKEMLDKGE